MRLRPLKRSLFSLDDVSPTFCVLPWIHFNTTTGNLFRYCCLMPEPARDASGRPFLLEKNTVGEMWNGPEMRNLRESMVRGEKVSSCQKCYSEELVGSRSLRKDYGEMWIGKDHEMIAARVKESSRNGGYLSANPVFIELKFGNQCNIKCRMCSPNDSSQVQLEYEKIAQVDERFDLLWAHRNEVLGAPEIKLGDLGVWFENKESWDGILQILPGLSKIHFAGGEPTLHKKFYEFLELCLELKLQNQIEISFNSNLTTISERLLGLLTQFRRVIIHASIDGFGIVQEYIRYPSKWEVIEKNLKKIAAVGPPITLVVSPTLQIYNIGKIIDLFRFVDGISTQTSKGSVEITPGILDNPHILNFRHLPVDYRLKICDDLERYRATVPTSWWQERLGTITGLLAADYDEQIARSANRDFLHFTKLLDLKRGQSFESIFPDLYRVVHAFT